MSAKRKVVALGLVLLALGTSRAEAEPITLSFAFIASGFESGAPVDPVTGAFTITFDNSTNHFEQTTGLTYYNLNITLDSAPSFDYARSEDGLLLGAAVSGTSVIGSGSNDFAFSIRNVSTNPVAGPSFIYSQASTFSPFHGAIVLTPFVAPTPTPEPGTLVLFGTGAAVALIRRRRVGQR
jgi:hypothetical protein